MSRPYDLIIIGAGSAGLTGAEFAAKLGARVALVEKEKIGGDCTWYGCVPSKALLHAAAVVRQGRQAAQFNLGPPQPGATDMRAVRRHIDASIEHIYAQESPEQLAAQGIEVVSGKAHFIDPHTIQVGERQLRGNNFLIASGAAPVTPRIAGLDTVNYHTNLTIFANERLPDHLITIGAGPMGLEVAQAYRWLGASVSMVDVGLLPGREAAVSQLLSDIIAGEGIDFISGQVESIASLADGRLAVQAGARRLEGDMLLVAVGRRPNLASLNLTQAGVTVAQSGLTVNEHLQTNVAHIYGAGDCLGGEQFTHLAGWQGFQATRNALLPGKSAGFPTVLPWAVYTSPEVAGVGLTAAAAAERYGPSITILKRSLSHVDRAVVDADRHGFIKVVAHKGQIVGAIIVAARASEMITEFALAIKHKLSIQDLAGTLHPYPSYTTGVQRLLADAATESFVGSLTGRFLRRLKGYDSPLT